MSGEFRADARLERVYRALLSLYPREFRERFGADIADTLRDRVRAARLSRGAPGAADAWRRAFADLLLCAAAERIEQVRGAAHAVAGILRGLAQPESTSTNGESMNTFLQDARYAARGIVVRPGFSAIVILTLALGIGANTAIFSVVEGVLLRALPYAHPEGIVHLTHESPYGQVSEGEFVDYRDQAHSFARVAAYSGAAANLTGDHEPEKIEAARVSDGFFSILGVTPALGRTFTPDEDRRGNPRVVVLSYGLWQRQFGGDSAAVGKPIRINGNAFTVVGVLPRHFDYPSTAVAVWVPLRLNYDTLWTRNNHYLQMVGRLAPGASVGAARAELAGLSRTWPAQFPETYGAGAPPVAVLATITDDVLGHTRPYLLALLGAVVFVLVIACVNVANLMLSRTESRRREIAIRTALGATRGRIVRQVLTESGLYSAAGALLGLPLAWGGWRVLRGLAPDSIPRLDQVALNVPVLVFTLVTACLTGLLFGFVPALRAGEANAGESLKFGGKSAGQAHGLRRARRVLVVAEVALAVVTLTGAGLMLRSLARLQSVDLGLHPEHVLSVQVSASPTVYTGEKAVAFYGDLLARVRATPGVRAAGAIADLPIADGFSTYSILLDGQPMTTVANSPSATPEQVTPGYLEALGIPIVKGRALTDDDRANTPLVVVVNEAMVRKYWPNTDPIGHTIKMLNDKAPWATVVGVARDVRHGGYQAVSPPTMYFPYAQSALSVYYAPATMSLVVKAAGDEAALTAPIRAIVRALDPAVPLARIQTMESLVASSVASRRFSTQLLALFAALALVLAAIGIYGVISYSVSQRAFEIGLRMALGAQSEQVLRLVIREGLVLAGMGLVIGGVGAVAVMRLARSLLVDVSIADPLTLTVVATLLGAVAALASYVPARRATALEPTVTLRSG